MGSFRMGINKWPSLLLLASVLVIIYFQYGTITFLTRTQLRKRTIEWFNGNPESLTDDPALIAIIEKQFLFPPSTENYNLRGDKNFLVPKNNPSAAQVQRLDGILRSMSPGFYVESGAMDGITSSNTLWLEMQLAWQGLLIEPHPGGFKTLKSRHRKAWTSNVCLSILPYPVNATFYGNDRAVDLSALNASKAYGATRAYSVQCIPLLSMLLALNRTTIDFFSLDVEGNELGILRTIPFDRVTIKLITIEHTFIPGGLKALTEFMESKGFIFYQTITRNPEGKEMSVDDAVYIHPTLNLTEAQKKIIGSKDPPRKIRLRVK